MSVQNIVEKYPTIDVNYLHTCKIWTIVGANHFSFKWATHTSDWYFSTNNKQDFAHTNNSDLNTLPTHYFHSNLYQSLMQIIMVAQTCTNDWLQTISSTQTCINHWRKLLFPLKLASTISENHFHSKLHQPLVQTTDFQGHDDTHFLCSDFTWETVINIVKLRFAQTFASTVDANHDSTNNNQDHTLSEHHHPQVIKPLQFKRQNILNDWRHTIVTTKNSCRVNENNAESN